MCFCESVYLCVLKWACEPPSQTAHSVPYLPLRHRTKLYTPRATIMSLKEVSLAPHFSISSLSSSLSLSPQSALCFLSSLSILYFNHILFLHPFVQHPPPYLSVKFKACETAKATVSHLCANYSFLWCILTQTEQWNLFSTKNKWFGLTCN